MNILLALILVVLAVQIGLSVLFLWRLRGLYRSFLSFIQPEAEGKPSPLALFCQSIADMAGRSIVAGIKSTFMGKQSGDIRAEKAIEADIAQDMVSQSSPLIGNILQSFPSLGKTLRRNPALADLALQLLSRRLGGQGNTNPSNGPGEQVKFKL